MHILVIDDEESQRDILRDILSAAGYMVSTAGDGEEGLQQLQGDTIDMVLTDLKMPRKDGFEVLQGVKAFNPEIPVIMMTAFGSIPGAVNAIKNGAYDYLTKPFKKDELLQVVKRAADRVRLLQENRRLKEEISDRYRFQQLIGKDQAMRHVYTLIERIKDVDATVLICGESGTGKELVARAIHYSGKRKEGPFIAINCGAIPENLIESELFGHERGAFTGANQAHQGKFEQAHGGTLFLDEIGTMRPDLQIRLLRVLQEKTIQRIGSNRNIELDVRVLAASNEDLPAKVARNEFRADLFHRLDVFSIQLPPLRERKGDIALLARHFIAKYAGRYGREIPRLSAEALQKLEQYDFPGNVRELENIIEKAIILNDSSIIGADDLPITSTISRPRGTDGAEVSTLPDWEKKMLTEALQQSHGFLKQAAQSLGITYKTLQYRLKKYGIDKKQFRG